MKNRKRRINLLQEVVPLNDCVQMMKEGIFPLGIVLDNEELKEYEEYRNGKAQNTSSKFLLIDDFYLLFTRYSCFQLNPYALRRKIENDEVYIDKFIDKDSKIKNVRFIAPAFGFDLDAPKIVFRKTPRLFFKTMDHFSMNTKYQGEDLLSLSFDTVFEYHEKIKQKNRT